MGTGFCFSGRSLLEGERAHFTPLNAMVGAGRPHGPFVSMCVCGCVRVQGVLSQGRCRGGRTVYKRGSCLLYKLFPLMEMGMCLCNKIY